MKFVRKPEVIDVIGSPGTGGWENTDPNGDPIWVSNLDMEHRYEIAEGRTFADAVRLSANFKMRRKHWGEDFVLALAGGVAYMKDARSNCFWLCNDRDKEMRDWEVISLR